MSKKERLENDIKKINKYLDSIRYKLNDMKSWKSLMIRCHDSLEDIKKQENKITRLVKLQVILQKKLNETKKELSLLERYVRKDCGYSLENEDFKFCPNCGRKLDDVRVR